jgi:hypothetical protein
MNMRKPCLYLALAVVIAMTALLVGCPKKAQPPPDSAALPTPPGPDADQPEAVTPETGEPEVPEVVLTKELVDQWVACAKDEKIKKLLHDVGSGKPDDDPGLIRSAIEGLGTSAELEAAVKGHGFDSAEQWVGVTLKVMAGLFNASVAEAEKQMAELGDAPGLEETKAEMEKQITAFREAFGELTDDEQQIVDDALDQIEDAMKQDDDSAGAADE